MTRKLLVADLFCGAGGSSTGARRALAARGIEMELACVNHWPVAIETHKKNHPDARHYCMDVDAAKPEEIVPEGRLDLLMASPTCTYHSRARGGRPIHDQQRMDPWHVVRWCTALRVKALIVENVPEFVAWGPLDARTGRPLKSRQGEHFRAWVQALEGIGMRVDWRVLNAADYGDATTRQRFFLLGRSDKRPIRWPEPTHVAGGAVDLLGRRKPWRAAREIIDWSLPGTSIFDRARPLAPNTLKRIGAGLARFGGPLAGAFLVVLRRHCDALSLDVPLPTVTAGGTHLGIAAPFVAPYYGTGAPDSVEAPLAAVTTVGRFGLVQPGAEPFTFANRTNNVPQSIDGPVPTIVTSGNLWLAQPFTFPVNQGHGRTRGLRDVAEPLPTIVTGESLGVAEPFALAQGGGGMPRPVSDPLPTILTGGAVSLVEPFVLAQHHPASGKVRSVDRPLPAVTTVARPQLVEPWVQPITHSRDEGRVRSVDLPLATVTGASRGEMALIEPFLVPNFGERPPSANAQGQAPRVHGVEAPLPSVTSHGAGCLAEPIAAPGSAPLDRVVLIDGVPHLLDVRFRMLQPHELAGATSFNDDAIAYEFTGTKTEIIKQIGNAVPVRIAAALVDAQVHDVAPRAAPARREAA